jgi:hypothetical protein
VAVIKKVCDVLIGLGVQPSNIVLYDACNDASAWYNPYIDLTDSTKIRAVMSTRASSLGGYAPVTLVNWNPAGGTCGCPADLVNGKIDILVNIAVAKINSNVAGTYSFGAITACMKNHFGTFTNSQAANSSVGLHPTAGKPPLALFEINQHAAILGGNPVRQQLCIVDALFSSTGPTSAPDNVTDRLVMGTFAPMVDYFTANYILLNPAVMTATPVPPAAITAAATVLPQFATSFGYTAPAASPTAPDPSWVSYPASSPPPINPSGSGGTGGSVDAGGGGGGASGTKDAGGGGSSGSQDAGGGGGTSGAKDAGGTSVSVDAGGGGTSVSADAASGVPSGAVDAGSGVPTGSVDAGSGVPSGSADAASGGTPSGAGGAGGADGAATSPGPASADAATPGGTSTGTGTGAIPPGGGSGTPGSTAASGKSGGGCDVAGADRGATRWSAMLAFGAVVAEKLRRLAGGNDRSS